MPSPLTGIVVLTDGVMGFSSPSSMHNAVNQMRGANISCWVIQVYTGQWSKRGSEGNGEAQTVCFTFTLEMLHNWIHMCTV